VAYTLSNLLQDVYMDLGQFNVSTATGGTTATLVDSKQVGLHKDNAWLNGACFIIRDVAGASAAPEGEFALVTGYTSSSGTFTSAASSYTVAPADGDTYGFVNNFYPLHTVRELCNLGIQALGDVALVDTSLTTAASQREYALPAACKRNRPLEVAIQGETGDSDDNAYVPIYDYDYIPAAAGSTGTIQFKRQPASGRTIRIVYEGIHPKLTAYSSVVHETIHPELAKVSATEMCLRWQNSRLQGGDDFLLQRWNDAKQTLLMEKTMHPVWKPRRKSRLFILGDTDTRYSRFSGDVLP